MEFSAAIEHLYRLNTGVIGTGAARHERPHKPVLLLAVLDAVAAGQARPDRVPWSVWLRQRFAAYFEVVRSHDDTCEPELPFYYLRSDELWKPLVANPDGSSPLPAPPKARDADTGRVFARLAAGWDTLIANPVSRTALRDALIARYFPHARPALTPLFLEPALNLGAEETTLAEDDDAPEMPGRSAGFRRRIVELYDHQCAACGLRIRLPEPEVTFVDAAHLVPFSESRNDHPTNGLALCKNHHWALDQHLIAPDPSRVWRVSRRIDSRRSLGEKELAGLNGQKLLAPAESAFNPDPRGLEWRFERLLDQAM